MKKIQFCCGENRLDGWDNRDKNTDISQKLPFTDASVDLIFIEHGIEHVTQYEAYGFLQECYRILNKNGRIRIAFPDITKIMESQDGSFNGFLSMYFGLIECTNAECVKRTITEWEHKSFWNFAIMSTLLQSIGFYTDPVNYKVRESARPELAGLEQHDKAHNGKFSQGYQAHTSIIEAFKL